MRMASFFANVLTDCFSDDETQSCFWKDSESSGFAENCVDERSCNRCIETINRTYLGEVTVISRGPCGIYAAYDNDIGIEMLANVNPANMSRRM
jgi:hypothetical protein